MMFITPGKELQSSSSDTDEITPDDIAFELLREIEFRFDSLKELRDYYEGEPYENYFQVEPDQEFNGLETLQRMSQGKYAKLIVAATVDKLGILGFRTAAGGSEEGDEVAEQAFEDDDMGVVSQEAMRLACAYKSSYLWIEPISGRQKVIPPTNAAVIPDIYGEPAAALVMLHDRYREVDVLYLYTRMVDDSTGAATGPVTCFMASRENSRTYRYSVEPQSIVRVANVDTEIPLSKYMSSDWVWWTTTNPKIDRIPVTPLRNEEGKSEFEEYLPIIDRINHMIYQRVIIATFQAFKQRAVKGDIDRRNPETGELIDYGEEFAAGPARFWMLPEGTDIWESSTTSFQDILLAVKDDIKDLANQSRTPVSYLSDSVNQSAAGSNNQEAAHRAKVKSRRRRFSSRWRRHLSILFEVKGDKERSDITRLETIWESINTDSLTDQTAAFQSLVSSGVAISTAARVSLAMTPSEIRRLEQERQEQALTEAMTSAIGKVTPLEKASYGQTAQISQDKQTSGTAQQTPKGSDSTDKAAEKKGAAK